MHLQAQESSDEIPSIWPRGFQAAVSFSFDDACFSQADTALPLLDSLGVKASFYISIWSSKQRMTKWQEAIRQGHEIGNHTFYHPCTGSFGRSMDLTLEAYRLRHMRKDIKRANDSIENLYGISTKTFAYPCGQKFVGAGRQTRSYVPLIAKQFLAGRSYHDEGANDPQRCDLAQLLGITMDDKTMEDLQTKLDLAIEQRQWLILVGHHVGTKAPLTTDVEMLSSLIQWLQTRGDIWIAPVHEIASYLEGQR